MVDILDNIDQTGVIVVDMQADFTQQQQGGLAVEGTDKPYLDLVNSTTKALKAKGYKLFATQDFHPLNHISFYSNHAGKHPFDTIEVDDRAQVLWPPHCVKETNGAEILLETGMFDQIIRKGMDPQFDSYSGFFDDGGSATGLNDILKSHHINSLIIYGLALDYCVKATALDAAALGYKVMLLPELCRGVARDSSESALEEMASAGILFETLGP